MDLFWIALLAIILGGYGLIRGFARDVCISVILIATGVMLAQLVWFDRHWAYLLAMLVTVITLFGCLREGRRAGAGTRTGRPDPHAGRTRRPAAGRRAEAKVTPRRRSGRGC
ncbi:hypothetical protein C7446_2440 [Kushneria sinocarnis]|uniref:Uncharacterized protein n=1 Tax=Kushneria sinocarnis TaxID=595502 RepID=A0A420WUA7_9GAMM|nr:hypothetical protein [Kushneria sinocarnis]RKQ97024.1 hypothetical protein C7446_2440 [Kushneria sinocarnis]